MAVGAVDLGRTHSNRCLRKRWEAWLREVAREAAAVLECNRWAQVFSRCNSGVLACNSSSFQQGLASAEDNNSLERQKIVMRQKKGSKIGMFRMGISEEGMKRVKKQIWETCSLGASSKGLPMGGKRRRTSGASSQRISSGRQKSSASSAAEAASSCSFSLPTLSLLPSGWCLVCWDLTFDTNALHRIIIPFY